MMLHEGRAKSCADVGQVRVVRIEPKPRCSDENDSLGGDLYDEVCLSSFFVKQSHRVMTVLSKPPSMREVRLLAPPMKSSGLLFKSSSAEVIQAYSKSFSTTDLQLNNPSIVTNNYNINSINDSNAIIINNNNNNNDKDIKDSASAQSFSAAELRRTLTTTPSSLMLNRSLLEPTPLSAVGRSTSMSALRSESGGYSKKDRTNTPYEKIWSTLEADNDEVNTPSFNLPFRTLMIII